MKTVTIPLADFEHLMDLAESEVDYYDESRYEDALELMKRMYDSLVVAGSTAKFGYDRGTHSAKHYARELEKHIKERADEAAEDAKKDAEG